MNYCDCPNCKTENCPSGAEAARMSEAYELAFNELKDENTRLIRDMVLHERALEQAMEREERLREVLGKMLKLASTGDWDGEDPVVEAEHILSNVEPK